MGNLFREAGQALGGPFWVEFTRFLADEAGPTIEGYGKIVGNVITGFAGMGQAFGSFGDDIRNKLLELTGEFRDFGQGKGGGLQSFVDYIKVNGPIVSDTFGAMFRAAGHVIEALAPIGTRVLINIQHFSDAIANIPVDRLSKILTVSLGLITALAGLVTVVSVVSTVATGFKFLGSTVGLVAGGIPLLVAGLVILDRHFKPFHDFLHNQLLPILERLGNEAMDGIQAGMDHVREAIERNRPSLDILARLVQVSWSSSSRTRLLPLLGPVLKGAFDALGGVIGGLIDVLGFLVGAADALSGPLEGVAIGITAIWAAGKLIKGMRSLFTPVAAGVERVAGKMLAVGNNIQLAGTQMQTFGTATQSKVLSATGGAIKGFGRFTAFLSGPWGLAILAATAVLGALVLKHKQAKDEAKAWADQLVIENGALDENSRRATANKLAKDGTLASAAKAGVSEKDFTDALLNGGPAREAMIQHLRDIAEQHTVYANTGQLTVTSTDDQADAANAAADELATMGGELDNAKTSSQQAGNALRDAKPPTDNLKVAAEGLKGAQKELATATQEVIDKFTVLNGGAIDAAQAQLTLNTSFLDIAESAKQNGNTLDENTQKGIANRTSIIDATKAINDKIKADFESNVKTKGLSKATDIASEALRKNRKHLEDVAVKAGFSKDKVHDMIEQYLKTPDQLKTEIKADTKKAKGDVKAWQDQLDGVPKIKTVTGEMKFKTNAAGVITDLNKSFQLVKGGPKMTLAAGGRVDGSAPRHWFPDAQHLAYGGRVQNFSGKGERSYDTEPAMLRVNEHVWTPEEVRGAGGHERVEHLRQAAKSGLLHFAAGGAVRRKVDEALGLAATNTAHSNAAIRGLNSGTEMLGYGLQKILGKLNDQVQQAKQLASPGPISGFSADQMKNAATIASVGSSMGYRAQLIGIATAIVESGLRNLKSGDRDSVGLFQQRAPWGSFKDRTNPRVAAGMFFHGGHGGQRGLDDFNWSKMSPGAAAQAVQVSAFPGRYAQQMANAARVLDAITNGGGVIGGETGGHRWPTNTRALSPNYRGHSGVDIRAGMGAPIWAAANGRIDYAGWGRGYGQAIFENSGGLPMVYGHTSKLLVRTGQRVKAGQLIGKVGATGNATGPHLHFEIAPNGFDRASNRGRRWTGCGPGSTTTAAGCSRARPSCTTTPEARSRC
jgi:murein DD-endopeptidase MepM/ murein hydrolase activator NlpD